jgi:nitrogenase molybdenum-cofactor synthesis protein NifE
MVHVRQSIYSLLEPMKKKMDTVNILGYFAPLIEDCELYNLLHHIGMKKINEISRCRDFDEYMHMAEANFNLVLNPEARLAAQDIMKRLNIPSAELVRLYQIDKIHNQYRIFTRAIGTSFEDQKYYDEAEKAIGEFKAVYPDAAFAVGEAANANSFELSLALIRYGFKVAEIYASPAAEDFVYIRKIAKLSPETRIYSNLEPTMLYYDCSEEKIDITIGSDAHYYHPGCANVPWNQEIQPFGYAGVKKLFEELKHSLDCFDKEA